MYELLSWMRQTETANARCRRSRTFDIAETTLRARTRPRVIQVEKQTISVIKFAAIKMNTGTRTHKSYMRDASHYLHWQHLHVLRREQHGTHPACSCRWYLVKGSSLMR
jgi:hypothetical protein